MSKKKILIYIPAYKAAHTLASVFRRAPASVKNSADFLVVDNASPDKTYEAALECKRKKLAPSITAIHNKTNQGYGGSQKIAYRYAIKQGYDYVVMLHADGQYPPEKVPEIIGLLDKGADMAFGSRITGNPLQGGMPKWKYFGNRCLNVIENFVTWLWISEYHSGFRAYRCGALASVPFERCSSDYHFDTDILIQFAAKRLTIMEFPIPTHYGKESHTISPGEVVVYSSGILKSLAEYMLHRTRLRHSHKFDVHGRKK